MPTLGQDLLKLKKLKDEASAKKKVYEKAELEMKKWQAHCVDRMEAEESEGHRSRGSLFTPVSKAYATIQDREAFIAWAKDNDIELIQEKERAAELNALVRAALDDGEELPPGVGFYTRDYISVRTA